MTRLLIPIVLAPILAGLFDLAPAIGYAAGIRPIASHVGWAIAHHAVQAFSRPSGARLQEMKDLKLSGAVAVPALKCWATIDRAYGTADAMVGNGPPYISADAVVRDGPTHTSADVVVGNSPPYNSPATGQPVAGTLPAANVRFGYVDVYIDPRGTPLAAYQFELKVASGDVKIVGIEGGEHNAFREPPYYDPAALMNGRVILAAFNTGADLPATKTRVARVHVRIAGAEQPQYSISMEAAADASGRPIAVTASVTEGEDR
jgi:hypothetical protein